MRFDAAVPGEWPKRCACGRVHTPDSWPDLPLVTSPAAPSGEIDDGEFLLQFRLCYCGSSLAVHVVKR